MAAVPELKWIKATIGNTIEIANHINQSLIQSMADYVIQLQLIGVDICVSKIPA